VSGQEEGELSNIKRRPLCSLSKAQRLYGTNKTTFIRPQRQQKRDIQAG